MSLVYRFDKSKGILYITVNYFFTEKDMEKASKYITNSRDFPADVDTIWDIRAVNFDNIKLTYQEKLISIRKRYPQRGNAKIAIVAESDLAFGLSRRYEQMSAELPQETMVFKSIKEAEKWILSDI